MSLFLKNLPKSFFRAIVSSRPIFSKSTSLFASISHNHKLPVYPILRTHARNLAFGKHQDRRFYAKKPKKGSKEKISGLKEKTSSPVSCTTNKGIIECKVNYEAFGKGSGSRKPPNEPTKKKEAPKPKLNLPKYEKEIKESERVDVKAITGTWVSKKCQKFDFTSSSCKKFDEETKPVKLEDQGGQPSRLFEACKKVSSKKLPAKASKEEVIIKPCKTKSSSKPSKKKSSASKAAKINPCKNKAKLQPRKKTKKAINPCKHQKSKIVRKKPSKAEAPDQNPLSKCIEQCKQPKPGEKDDKSCKPCNKKPKIEKKPKKPRETCLRTDAPKPGGGNSSLVLVTFDQVGGGAAAKNENEEIAKLKKQLEDCRRESLKPYKKNECVESPKLDTTLPKVQTPEKDVISGTKSLLQSVCGGIFQSKSTPTVKKSKESLKKTKSAIPIDPCKNQGQKGKELKVEKIDPCKSFEKKTKVSPSSSDLKVKASKSTTLAKKQNVKYEKKVQDCKSTVKKKKSSIKIQKDQSSKSSLPKKNSEEKQKLEACKSAMMNAIKKDKKLEACKSASSGKQTKKEDQKKSVKEQKAEACKSTSSMKKQKMPCQFSAPKQATKKGSKQADKNIKEIKICPSKSVTKKGSKPDQQIQVCPSSKQLNKKISKKEEIKICPSKNVTKKESKQDIQQIQVCPSSKQLDKKISKKEEIKICPSKSLTKKGSKISLAKSASIKACSKKESGVTKINPCSSFKTKSETKMKKSKEAITKIVVCKSATVQKSGDKYAGEPSDQSPIMQCIALCRKKKKADTPQVGKGVPTRDKNPCSKDSKVYKKLVNFDDSPKTAQKDESLVPCKVEESQDTAKIFVPCKSEEIKPGIRKPDEETLEIQPCKKLEKKVSKKLKPCPEKDSPFRPEKVKSGLALERKVGCNFVPAKFEIGKSGKSLERKEDCNFVPAKFEKGSSGKSLERKEGCNFVPAKFEKGNIGKSLERKEGCNFVPAKFEGIRSSLNQKNEDQEIEGKCCPNFEFKCPENKEMVLSKAETVDSNTFFSKATKAKAIDPCRFLKKGKTNQKRAIEEKLEMIDPCKTLASKAKTEVAETKERIDACKSSEKKNLSSKPKKSKSKKALEDEVKIIDPCKSFETGAKEIVPIIDPCRSLNEEILDSVAEEIKMIDPCTSSKTERSDTKLQERTTEEKDSCRSSSKDDVKALKEKLVIRTTKEQKLLISEEEPIEGQEMWTKCSKFEFRCPQSSSSKEKCLEKINPSKSLKDLGSKELIKIIDPCKSLNAESLEKIDPCRKSDETGKHDLHGKTTRNYSTYKACPKFENPCPDFQKKKNVVKLIDPCASIKLKEKQKSEAVQPIEPCGSMKQNKKQKSEVLEPIDPCSSLLKAKIEDKKMDSCKDSKRSIDPCGGDTSLLTFKTASNTSLIIGTYQKDSVFEMNRKILEVVEQIQKDFKDSTSSVPKLDRSLPKIEPQKKDFFGTGLNFFRNLYKALFATTEKVSGSKSVDSIKQQSSKGSLKKNKSSEDILKKPKEQKLVTKKEKSKSLDSMEKIKKVDSKPQNQKKAARKTQPKIQEVFVCKPKSKKCKPYVRPLPPCEYTELKRLKPLVSCKKPTKEEPKSDPKMEEMEHIVTCNSKVCDHKSCTETKPKKKKLTIDKSKSEIVICEKPKETKKIGSCDSIMPSDCRTLSPKDVEDRLNIKRTECPKVEEKVTQNCKQNKVKQLVEYYETIKDVTPCKYEDIKDELLSKITKGGSCELDPIDPCKSLKDFQEAKIEDPCGKIKDSSRMKMVDQRPVDPCSSPKDLKKGFPKKLKEQCTDSGKPIDPCSSLKDLKKGSSRKPKEPSSCLDKPIDPCSSLKDPKKGLLGKPKGQCRDLGKPIDPCTSLKDLKKGFSKKLKEQGSDLGKPIDPCSSLKDLKKRSPRKPKGPSYKPIDPCSSLKDLKKGSSKKLKEQCSDLGKPINPCSRLKDLKKGSLRKPKEPSSCLDKPIYPCSSLKDLKKGTLGKPKEQCPGLSKPIDPCRSLKNSKKESSLKPIEPCPDFGKKTKSETCTQDYLKSKMRSLETKPKKIKSETVLSLKPKRKFICPEETPQDELKKCEEARLKKKDITFNSGKTCPKLKNPCPDFAKKMIDPCKAAASSKKKDEKCFKENISELSKAANSALVLMTYDQVISKTKVEEKCVSGKSSGKKKAFPCDPIEPCKNLGSKKDKKEICSSTSIDPCESLPKNKTQKKKQDFSMEPIIPCKDSKSKTGLDVAPVIPCKNLSSKKKEEPCSSAPVDPCRDFLDKKQKSLNPAKQFCKKAGKINRKQDNSSNPVNPCRKFLDKSSNALNPTKTFCKKAGLIKCEDLKQGEAFPGLVSPCRLNGSRLNRTL